MDTKNPPNRTRTERLEIKFTKEEMQLLEQKMKAAGMRNKGEYLRSFVKHGEVRVINFDFSELEEQRRLVANAVNNVNQVAKRANSAKSVYELDVIELKNEIEAIYNAIADTVAKAMIIANESK